MLMNLQRTAGNAAVARMIAAARANEEGPVGRAPVVQRAQEKIEMRPPPQAGSETFGGPLQEDDLRLLTEAVHEVQQIVNRAREEDPDRKILLYIGVGTGNPTGGWGNNTVGGVGGITDEDQSSPGFLAQAGEADYKVISLNFQVGTGKGISPSDGSGPVVKLTVPARFPLNAEDEAKAQDAMTALHTIADQADRFAIMNAVTQADYQPLLNLMAAKKGGRAAYLKSYMATGKTSAYSPMSKKTGQHIEDSTFASMSDVFLADQQE
ncbi:hypothetical protein [Streptomyces sp. NPDC101178]|uniref:hypothetical protein n=1 Tax=Streptomyces sp. NPDC101178 TaxID=3366124 RepID=UPI003821F058